MHVSYGYNASEVPDKHTYSTNPNFAIGIPKIR